MYLFVFVEVKCRVRVDINGFYFLCEWGDDVD